MNKPAAMVQAAGTSKADYKLATAKCDALSGDTKAACMTAAKAQFGKS